MPRAFSAQQRETILRSLNAAAREHFGRFGYRRASVAEMARDAGIGKGSVYLFFASKAELFASAALEAEAELRASLVEAMSAPFASPRELIRCFFRFQLEALRGHPLLAVLVDPLEAAALFRDLPPEAMTELRASDDRFFAELLEPWRARGEIASVEPALFGALSRAVFALSLQRTLIGEDEFPAVADLVIEGLSRVLVPGEDQGDD